MKSFFDQRNKKITNLSLLADNLGHTLRENVSVFSIDGQSNQVTFITESGNIIEGNFYFTDKIILDNIVVESGEVFTDKEKFDSAAKNQISLLIESVYSNKLAESGDIFDSILDSWTQRIQFNETVDKLREKRESFNNTFNIIGTTEFERFIELSENISKFISENIDKIKQVPEIKNAVRLSNTISEAFNFNRLSLEQLAEQGSIEYGLSDSSDIYEMVCRQELIKREILESKKSFDSVWVTNEKVSNLASKVFEDDDAVIKQSLVEAFIEIPYLSLISKKQLSSTITKNLSVIHEDLEVSKSEIKEFTKKLFEMKKPLKSLVSNMLQEKYGVNLNNIKDAPTFKTLLNTQSLIFESLAKLAPRSSVIKESLIKMSEMLKSKNGVEAIDINKGLRYLFENSGLADVYEDSGISIDFSLQESFDSSDDVVKLIMEELMDEQVAEVEEEEDAETAEVNQVGSSKKEDGTSSLSTKELIDTLKDIESLLDEPTDISEE